MLTCEYSFRAIVERSMKEWLQGNQLIVAAQEALHVEQKKRAIMFEPAFKEVCIMLYQNLWTKFRTTETEMLAGDVTLFVRV